MILQYRELKSYLKVKNLLRNVHLLKGRYLPEAARATDDELIEKFKLNASRIYPRQILIKLLTIFYAWMKLKMYPTL